MYSEKNLTGACNPEYFRLRIDLTHINPPVTVEGFDGSHHPRYAECHIHTKNFHTGSDEKNISL